MVLAHQGGWDEALMVLAPLALLFLLLRIANRRAKAQFEASAEQAGAGDGDDPLDGAADDGAADDGAADGAAGEVPPPGERGSTSAS